MGLLLDRFVMDRDRKFWITVVLDILIIVSLVYFADKVKWEWQNGFDYCYNKACMICWENITIRDKESLFPLFQYPVAGLNTTSSVE